jgi:hypothetical protein
MMFCTKCGNALPKGTAFCSKCGVQVGRTVTSNARSTIRKSKNTKGIAIIITLAVIAIITVFAILLVFGNGEGNFYSSEPSHELVGRWENKDRWENLEVTNFFEYYGIDNGFWGPDWIEFFDNGVAVVSNGWLTQFMNWYILDDELWFNINYAGLQSFNVYFSILGEELVLQDLFFAGDEPFMGQGSPRVNAFMRQNNPQMDVFGENHPFLGEWSDNYGNAFAFYSDGYGSRQGGWIDGLCPTFLFCCHDSDVDGRVAFRWMTRGNQIIVLHTFGDFYAIIYDFQIRDSQLILERFNHKAPLARTN